MIIASTQRLILRTLDESDLDDLMNIWGNPEVMRYSGGAGSREQEKKALTFYIRLQTEKGYSPFGVIDKESKELFGVCGFNPPSDLGAIELMYHFAKENWGKGYATEAGKACIDYAQQQGITDKLAAFIDPANHGSEKVLRKLGFQYEGTAFHQGSGQVEPYFVYHF
ncbi:GNAT family N-acetyltransferase [Alkalibacterium sp.]|nr:MAG: N-acetyltransferase [Alkalibacterium sp.]